ncbi:MAG: hypothetical protein HC877_19770 [Thioploca sp.]|nr:hypothetical protein [Thioploca sp.]
MNKRNGILNAVANRLNKRSIITNTPLYPERDEEQRQEYLDQLNTDLTEIAILISMQLISPIN